MTNYIVDESTVLWTSDDGNKRIRAQRDELRDFAPENDGAMITLRVGEEEQEIVRGHYTLGVDDYLKHDPHFDDIYREFDMRTWQGWTSPQDVFERYLRIFHGTRTFYSYGRNNYTDYEYLTFDTAVWRQVHGVTDEFMAERPDIDWSAQSDFDEYEHFLEGDSYGLILEHKRTVTTHAVDHVTGETEDDEDHEWHEEDAVWGFFTDDEDRLREWGLWQFGLDVPATPASS